MHISFKFLIVFLIESAYSTPGEDFEDVDDGESNSTNATRAPDIPTLLSIYAANAHMLALLQRMFGDNKTNLEYDQEQEKMSGSPVVKKLLKKFECKSNDKFKCMLKHPLTRNKNRDTNGNKRADTNPVTRSKCKNNCKHKCNATAEKRHLKSYLEDNSSNDIDGSETETLSNNTSSDGINPTEDDVINNCEDFSLKSRLYSKLPKVRQNRNFRIALQLPGLRKNQQTFEDTMLETNSDPNITASQTKNDSEHILTQRPNSFNFSGILNQILNAIKKKLPQNVTAPRNVKLHQNQTRSPKKKRPFFYFPLRNKIPKITPQPRQLYMTDASSSTIRAPKIKLVFLLLTSQNTTNVPPGLRNKSRRKFTTFTTEIENTTYKTTKRNHSQETYLSKYTEKRLSTTVNRYYKLVQTSTKTNFVKLHPEDIHVYWTSRPKWSMEQASKPQIPARHRKIL